MWSTIAGRLFMLLLAFTARMLGIAGRRPRAGMANRTGWRPADVNGPEPEPGTFASAEREIKRAIAIVESDLSAMREADAALARIQSAATPEPEQTDWRSKTRPAAKYTRILASLELIEKHPGITGAQLARKMNSADTSYVYRMLARLESNGEVERVGAGWKAVDGAYARAHAKFRKGQQTHQDNKQRRELRETRSKAIADDSDSDSDVIWDVWSAANIAASLPGGAVGRSQR